MSEPQYRSVTRTIPIVELPPELRNALVTHADQKKLRLIEAKAWLTHRENTASKTLLGRLLRRRSNHADPDTWHEMAFVVHSTHLLLASRGDSRPTHVDVMSVPLLTATLTRRARRADAPSDDGFEIGGFEAAKTVFMALGSGPAAEECLSAAKTAIEGATSDKRPGGG